MGFLRCRWFMRLLKGLRQLAQEIEIIVAPYHAGAFRERVGKGPHAILRSGLSDALKAQGFGVRVSEIGPVDMFEGEIGRSFAVKRLVAVAVRESITHDRFPVVLAGNCNTSVGVFAGLSDPDIGIMWFDAHPDFDTPDETVSGYFDGMGVATLAGQCWQSMMASIPDFASVSLDRFIYCGIRDFSPGQREKVEGYGIQAVFGDPKHTVDFPAELNPLLSILPDRTLVHIDLDCLDTNLGAANEYAAPGGLSADQLVACVTAVCEHSQPAGLTIASYNPDLSQDNRIARAGIAAAIALVTAM